MWNENEIDMEELEAHLYGQVHHPSTEDCTVPSSNDIPNNNNEQENSQNTYGHYRRYFNEYRIREPMRNFKSGYQESTYFNKSNRYHDSNINNTSFQHLPNLPNVYNSMGYVPEIALNNFLVLPPPASPHIFVQPDLSPQAIAKIRKKEKKREKRKIKRALVRKLLREQGYNKDSSEGKTFREHRLTQKPVNTNQEDDDCEIIPQEDDAVVVCLSESDGSDCEITIRAEESAILVSSDDEEKRLNSEIKSEKASSDVTSNNRNDLIQEGNLEIVDVNIENITLDATNTHGDDDDVVLIESRGEIIEISCDDSQSISGEKPASNSDSNISDSIDNSNNLSATPTIIPVIRPGTPESTTNDFLENSFSESNDANTGHSLNLQKDVCETESTSSTSDTEILPSRSSTFIEHEFDVPSQELNLDSFADFIGSGNKNCENASNLNNSQFQSSTPKASKGSKNKNTAEKNSSDSSSESDYDDNKSTMIRPKKKRALSLRSLSESSQSDCCIVENNSKTDKIGTPLPNLSPITSDEEMDKSKSSKQKESKKNKKRKSPPPPQETSRSGEKRKYPKEILEYLKSKRLKENEKDKEDVLSASSEELSEVDVAHSPEKEKLGNLNEFVDSSVELVNISSTVSKEPTLFKQSEDSTEQHSTSFKDYWTDDMKKFYFESWGHEDFSVEKAQENMSDSPDLWKIHPTDQTFIKSRTRGVRCVRCNEFGHKSITCKAKPKPLSCNICGRVGHAHTRCPNSLCTSCGRKNYCFTTYCSRCANSRRIVCRLCSQHGHIDSRCPDLWRRYHLTTKPGPLIRPFNSSLKPKKDRWCSGCASHGHFEHECNYYNRTHASNDPTVCNYIDVYDMKASSTRTETQTQTSNDQTSPHHSNNPYNPNINSPWIVTNFRNPYMHNQNQSPYMQNQTFQQNQSFFQQLPIFQSVPSILTTLQQGSNFFFQKPNLTFSNQFIPQNIGGNAFQQNQPLSNSPLKNYSPEASQQESSLSSDKHTKHYLNFKGSIGGAALFSPQGSVFLKGLGNTTNVKIHAVKRKKNKKITYTCTLEGPSQQVVNVGKKITKFVKSNSSKSSRGCLKSIFKGKAFSLDALQESLTALDDTSTDWITITSNAYKPIIEINKKINFFQNNLKKEERGNVKAEVDKQRNMLKQLYVAVNSVLIGKLVVGDGNKHVRILRKYHFNDNINADQMKMLEKSYNYVFRNSKNLNVNYTSVINKLPVQEGLKDEADHIYKSGIDFCQKNKAPALLGKFQIFYQNVIRNNFKVGHVTRLQELLNQMKKMHSRKKAGRVNQ